MRKLFIEDMKGYTDTFMDIYQLTIKKINNKNCLQFYSRDYNAMPYTIALKDVKLCFMIDLETTNEIFRYEK